MPKEQGDKVRNPSQDQEMMMEQAEPYAEPGKDDGTGCQKGRETSPGTLARTRNDDGTKPVSWKN